MLSEVQVRQVWEEMLSGEIRAKYYADLSYRYSSRQRIAAWNAIFVVLLATLSWFLKSSLGWLGPGLLVCAVAFGGYSLLGQNKQKAAECDALQNRWKKLVSDYQTLWESSEDANAAEVLGKLDEEGRELTTASSRFPADKELLHKIRELPPPPPPSPAEPVSGQL